MSLSPTRPVDGCKMPRPWFHGHATAGPIYGVIKLDDSWDRALHPGERKLGNFVLPPFQRPPVWTLEQKVALIESIWNRLPIGSYVVNRVEAAGYGSPADNLLLDGQQRITALLDYVADAFPVMGYRWSELTDADQKTFSMIPMGYLECKLTDMDQIEEVYNRLAYGGTPHEPKDAETETFWRIYDPVIGCETFAIEAEAREIYGQFGGAAKGVRLTEVTEIERTLEGGD